MTKGTQYYESSEMVKALPLTARSPYNFASVYAVTIPNVQPSDNILCVAKAEVTNNLGFDVQVDQVIAAGVTDEAYPPLAEPDSIRSGNVTPAMHHLPITEVLADTGRSGTVTYSLVLAAASTAATQGDTVTVEQGYGNLKCTVTHATSS